MLTYFRLMLRSYRNQSIDLQFKSIDWFLCDWDIGLNWIEDYIYFREGGWF